MRIHADDERAEMSPDADLERGCEFGRQLRIEIVERGEHA